LSVFDAPTVVPNASLFAPTVAVPAAALAAKFGRGYPRGSAVTPLDTWLLAWVPYIADYLTAGDAARNSRLLAAAVATVESAAISSTWFAGGIIRMYLARPKE
jgi:hypothetical protein